MPRVLNIRDTGYKIPQGAVYVGRAMPRYGLSSSKWGNPYRVQGYGGSLRQAAHRTAVKLYREYLLNHPELAQAARQELRGKDLVCWCHTWDGQGPNPNFCHADVLLELANREGRS